MSRNGAGTYTLPSNSFNPAVTATPISATSWNATANDLATALTYSIASDGQTPTTVRIPFSQGILVNAGNVTSPSINFTSNLTTGLYLAGTGSPAIAAGGVQAFLFGAAGNVNPGTLSVDGALTGPTISSINSSLSVGVSSISSLTSALTSQSTSLSQISSLLSSTNSTVANVSTSTTGVSSSLSTTNVTVSAVSSSLSSTNSTVANVSTSTTNVSSSLSSTISTNVTQSTSLSQISSSLANVSTTLANVSTTVAAMPQGGTNANSSGYLGLPQNLQPGAYTTVLGDAGKDILHNSASVNTITIAANASVAYDIGTVIKVTAGSTGVVTLAVAGGDSLIWLPSGASGSRTITPPGYAVAEKMFSNQWWISGVGVT